MVVVWLGVDQEEQLLKKMELLQELQRLLLIRPSSLMSKL